jgi:hypothetical protein
MKTKGGKISNRNKMQAYQFALFAAARLHPLAPDATFPALRAANLAGPGEHAVAGERDVYGEGA